MGFVIPYFSLAHRISILCAATCICMTLVRAALYIPLCFGIKSLVSCVCPLKIVDNHLGGAVRGHTSPCKGADENSLCKTRPRIPHRIRPWWMRNRRTIPDSEISVQFGFGVIVISCEFNACKYDNCYLSVKLNRCGSMMTPMDLVCHHCSYLTYSNASCDYERHVLAAD